MGHNYGLNMTPLIFVILCGLGAVWSADVDNGCSPGWYINNGYCYLFNTQRIITQQQASDECEDFNAVPLRIESGDELAFIQQTVPKFTSDGFWTDMSDLRFDGTDSGTGVWQWGGYEPVNISYITWESYPTTNSQDACGAVNIQGAFENWHCDRRLGYICEVEQTQDSGCYFGWMITDNACFWFSNTSDPTQLLSWNDALAKCNSFPVPTGSNGTMKLVTLDSVKDAAYINSAMPDVAKTTTMFWTGLKKSGTAWGWYNNDKYTAGYVPWAHEPNHVNNNEHCVTLKTDGKFTDANCNAQKNYICRKQTDIENTDYYMGCNGWLRAGHKCYVFYDSPKTSWADARHRCQTTGGDLLKIGSADEKNWIEWQLTDESHPNAYWSGLNDQTTEGVYQWADGTMSDTSLIRWNSEPNQWKGDEDCVQILNDGVLNDADCFIHAPVICEYANPTNNGQCPNGWTAYSANNDCYYISASNVTFTWDEAETFCTKTMAQSSTVPTTLLAINTQAEAAFVTNMLQAITNAPTGWWTGLNDVKTEGVWTYPQAFNNPVDESLLNWNSEPKDPTGTKDCALILWGGRYFTAKCNWKRGFICESYPYGIVPSAGSGGGNGAGSGADRIATSNSFIYSIISAMFTLLLLKNA